MDKKFRKFSKCLAEQDYNIAAPLKPIQDKSK